MTRPRSAPWILDGKRVVSFVLFAMALPALAWEPRGHHLIASASLQALPTEMAPWFSGQEAVFIRASLEPDLWKANDASEVWRHRIACETYGGPAKVPLHEATARAQVGAFAFDQAGQLPWVIAERHRRLVEAFKAGDARRVVLEAGWLCHYVADAQVPLHTSRDRNGKATRQKGIHKRWEADLVEHGVTSLPTAAGAIAPADLPAAIAGWIRESHSLIPALLEADRQAGREAQGNSEAHTKAFWSLQNRQVLQQLNRAAERSGGLVLSAWVQAGRPQP